VAKASPILTSFNAGELSPRLEGRVDIAKYANGCAKLENFLPLVQGGALKRSGTRFVKEVKDSADETRLVAFEFSTTQAYILEFGDQYMRVYFNSGAALEATVAITGTTDATPIVVTTGAAHGYENGDQVYITGVATMTSINGKYFTVANKTATTFELSGTTAPGSGAGTGGTVARVYEIATDYAKADLEGLAFAQSADVLYIAHPDYAPRKLERTGHTAWTLTEIAFRWVPFAPENVDEDMVVYITASTGTGLTLKSNSPIFASGHVGGYFKLREIIESEYPEWQNAGAYNDTPDLQQNDTNITVGDFVFYEGNVYELEAIPGGAVSGRTAPVHREKTESDGRHDWQYRHSGSGYCKITAFVDAYTVTVESTTYIPRSVVDAGATITGASKAAQCVLNVAGPPERFRIGRKLYIKDVNGMTELNGNVYEIVGSGAGTITINVNSTGFTTYAGPNDGTCHLITHRWSHGAFSDERGYPRAVTFFEDRLWWGGTSSDPQTLWGSRTSEYEDHEETDDDVSALLFTINTDQVNAIEWFSAGKVLTVGTAGGEFVATGATETEALTPGNIRIVRHTNYGSKAEVQPVRVEQVVLFVQRAGRKIREFVSDFNTESFVAPDMTVLADHIALQRIKKMAYQQEPNRVLWCVLEDGELIAFTYERSQEVTAWHHHPIGGTDVLVESVAVIPHPDGNQDQVWLIVSRTINGGTKRYVEFIEEDWQRTNDIEDAFFVDSGLTYDDTPETTFSNLDHLEGETVKVLADGVPVADATVSSGAITLAAAASVVQVGLNYESVVQPMRLEAGGADGTAQGKTKRITNFIVRLDQTGTGLFYGPTDTDADMEELVIDAGELLDGDSEILPWPEGYEQIGKLTLKHTKPLPCTITALMPQVVVQDR
jgi:hypothetical protein